jgi:GTPase SAR1 family protein
MPPRKSSNTRKLSNSNDVNNFYNLMPPDMKKEYHNPNFQLHGIKIPFRMLIVGSSGSGKTNTLLELIKRMNDTFEQIIICCKAKCEPLYDFLSSKLPIQFHENGDIPNINDFKDGLKQTLIIFDDLVLMKDQSKIAEFFIRSRKYNMSCIYLSQSYYKTPKVIRININYLILKKLPSSRDLKMVLNENSIGINLKELTAIYNEIITNNKFDFILIDLDKSQIRHNFLEYLTLLT